MADNNDADILSELSEIEDIPGEDVTFDEASLDLDFDDDIDPPSKPAVRPPAPVAEKPKTKNPEPSKAEAERPKPKTKNPESSKAEAEKPKAKKIPPAESSVTEVDEVVVRAKRLRIVADKVVIEPGDISFA